MDGRVTYFVGHLLEPKPDMKLIPSKAAADLFNRTAVYAAAEGGNKNVLEMVLEAECHVQDVDRKHRMISYKLCPFFETSAPARAGHYLVSTFMGYLMGI